MRTGTHIVAPLVLVLALAGCAVAKDSFSDSKAGYVSDARAAAADWTQASIVTVTVLDYEFQPPQLNFEAGKAYRLRLQNNSKHTHFFAAEEFFKSIVAEKLIEDGGTIDHPLLKAISLGGGESKELLFVPVNKGIYNLKCTAPFHEAFGMTGTITIS
jgi:uncharacterized cupredoxin-like copper-binding protein